MINFNDFYATFSDILNVDNNCDGVSMMDIFRGENTIERAMATTYYDPMWSPNVTRFRNVFSQSNRYKLYKDGRFFRYEK